MINPDPKPITVKDLIEFLQKQDQTLEVIYALHSDYHFMTLGPTDDLYGHHPIIIDAQLVPSAGYLMRVGQSSIYYRETDKLPPKKYLAFPGN